MPQQGRSLSARSFPVNRKRSVTVSSSRKESFDSSRTNKSASYRQNHKNEVSRDRRKESRDYLKIDAADNENHLSNRSDYSENKKELSPWEQFENTIKQINISMSFVKHPCRFKYSSTYKQILGDIGVDGQLDADLNLNDDADIDTIGEVQAANKVLSDDNQVDDRATVCTELTVVPENMSQTFSQIEDQTLDTYEDLPSTLVDIKENDYESDSDASEERYAFPQLSDVISDRETLKKELYKRYIDAPWSWSKGVENRLPRYIREKMTFGPVTNSRSKTANVLLRNREGSGYHRQPIEGSDVVSRSATPRRPRPHTVQGFNSQSENAKMKTKKTVLFEKVF